MNRRGLSALPSDVRVSVSQIQGLIEDLGDFLEPYKKFFGERSEPRETGCQYVQGLIANLPRKSAEPIAELFGKDRKTVQRFVGMYEWPDEEVRRLMAKELVRTLGHPDGVIIFDPSAFPKQGRMSVGVARQWCGVKGKTDNCQVGCFVSYASPHGSSIVDGQLYLPEEWVNNSAMREICRVPPDVQFQKKWEIADQMLRTYESQLPHSRILADAEFGRCGEFRDRLSERGESYLLDIPRNLEIRVYQGNFLIPAPTTPEEWTKRALQRVWNRYDIRDTARGALFVEGIMVNVVTIREDKTHRHEILVVKRDLATGELRYALANGASKVSLRRLLQDWSRRHTVEECFQRAKSDLGMDHYEVRSWIGWHHHITMVLLALCFLEKERIKKRRSFSPSDSFSDCLDHERTDPCADQRFAIPGENRDKSIKKIVTGSVSKRITAKKTQILHCGAQETLVK